MEWLTLSFRSSKVSCWQTVVSILMLFKTEKPRVLGVVCTRGPSAAVHYANLMQKFGADRFFRTVKTDSYVLAW
ncbi:MAG: hypothetical protein V7638_201 [Acidobacteriota bacterium]|jgi:hypothetical protein